MRETLHTKRLELKVLHPDDYPFIRELLNSEGWLQFIGDRNVHSNDDAKKYMDGIIAKPNIWYWVVRLKDGGGAMGSITFLKRDYLDQFDIGFAFLPGCNGQGYAYEASSAVLSMVQQFPQHQTVLATILPGNLRSIRLLEKLGFTFLKEIIVSEERLDVYRSV